MHISRVLRPVGKISLLTAYKYHTYIKARQDTVSAQFDLINERHNRHIFLRKKSRPTAKDPQESTWNSLHECQVV